MLSLAVALSYHLTDLDYNFNYIHPHIKYTTEQNVVLGAYYNSEYDVSAYVAKKFEFKNIDLELGFVTGYYDNPLPFARLSTDGLFVAPALFGNDKDLGFVIGYEFKIY